MEKEENLYFYFIPIICRDCRLIRFLIFNFRKEMHVFVIFNRLVKRVINHQYHFNKEKIKSVYAGEENFLISRR